VDTLFPHIYGPLPIAAVIQAAMWVRADGEHWTLGSSARGTVTP
jgi:uncharacterized protein (DUF952 family)